MAALRLSLLLQVGFVLASSRTSADWPGGSPGARTHGRRPLAQLSAPQSITEAHLPRVVTAFLRTGDSSALRHANCSRKCELPAARGRAPHAAPHRSMSGVLDSVLHATNFLNVVLQANRSREHNLRRDIEWYHALVRSILEGDAKIHRAVVTFGGGASFAGPSVLLQATRSGGGIVLQDLSGSVAHRRLHDRGADTEWYHEMKDGRNTSFHKRLLSQDDAERARAQSFLPDRAHVRWSAPYLECEHGSFVPRWLLTLSAAFYGLKSNLAPEFR